MKYIFFFKFQDLYWTETRRGVGNFNFSKIFPNLSQFFLNIYSCFLKIFLDPNQFFLISLSYLQMCQSHRDTNSYRSRWQSISFKEARYAAHHEALKPQTK